MTRIIDAPPTRHHCDLPWKTGGYGSTGVADGTVAVCEECGRTWFSAPCYESLGPTERWYPIRWYHFRLRRRLQ